MGATWGTGYDRGQLQTSVRSAALRLTYPRLLFLLILLGLIAGGWAVDLWLVVALGLWAAGRLAIGRAFPRLRLRLRLQRTHLFAGERASLDAVLANPSWWPIPWVEVESRQSEDLSGGLRRVQWLPGGAVRTLQVQWYARARGVFRVGGFSLRGGDWFGLFRDEREVAPALDLVVFPRVFPLPAAPEGRRLPEGPRRDRASPFEDEMPSALRPYRPGDPRRRIAWRASARHDALLVREMPPVREVSTCLCIDLNPSAWADWQYGPELAISLAASLACDGRLAARPMGLAAWAATAVKGVRLSSEDQPPRMLWLPPRAGGRERRRILEVLAGVQPDRATAPDFGDLMRTLAARLPWGAQCAWIVPEDAPRLRELAAVWQSRGHPVTLLCLERRVGPAAERLGGNTLRAWEVGERAGFTFR